MIMAWIFCNQVSDNSCVAVSVRFRFLVSVGAAAIGSDWVDSSWRAPIMTIAGCDCNLGAGTR